jgi:hypothetical protein
VAGAAAIVAALAALATSVVAPQPAPQPSPLQRVVAPHERVGEPRIADVLQSVEEQEDALPGEQGSQRRRRQGRLGRGVEGRVVLRDQTSRGRDRSSSRPRGRVSSIGTRGEPPVAGLVAAAGKASRAV